MAKKFKDWLEEKGYDLGRNMYSGDGEWLTAYTNWLTEYVEQFLEDIEDSDAVLRFAPWDSCHIETKENGFYVYQLRDNERQIVGPFNTRGGAESWLDCDNDRHRGLTPLVSNPVSEWWDSVKYLDLWSAAIQNTLWANLWPQAQKDIANLYASIKNHGHH